MKHNGHLIFQYVIDCWSMCLDASAILSCNVVAYMNSVVLTLKINKLVEGNIKNFKLN